MEAKLIRLDEVDSTNRYLRDYQPAEGEGATIVVADFQTAGRGCGKNTWESERGKNLLFSLLVHPDGIPASQQFHISMAIARPPRWHTSQPAVPHLDGHITCRG